MNEIPIEELIARCKSIFEEGHYSRQRIVRYEALWRKGILKYMSDLGLTIYSPEIGKVCLTSYLSGAPNDHREQELVRSINVLDDCLLLGCIRMHSHTPVVHKLHGHIGEYMQPLIDYLRSIRRSETTIKDYQLYLGGFSRFLNEAGVHSPEEICQSLMVTFLNGIDEAKTSIVSAIRVLFRFWFENNVTKGDKSEYLTSFKYLRKERIPSFYDKGEVMTIEKSVDQTSGVGKRDYAMLLLATRLGLRASDIAGLKLDDIDWRNNAIRLVQYKTARPIELPLLADVGNAIIRYLKSGRPKSQSKQVFIASRAPYHVLGRQGVGSAINRIISNAGINLKDRRHGPHSMRHSLATAMLRNGTAMPVISESLGHKSTKTTMSYLRIDIDSILGCALPVPPVEDSFYNQKGGAFYE